MAVNAIDKLQFLSFIMCMSFVVKAERSSNSSTSKTYHTVSDISVKTGQNRSDKPEEYYHLSPKNQTKTADEETFSLGHTSVM